MNEPILLTPGPLTTRIETRRAMLRDWGSRDPAFIALTAELRARLLAVAQGEATHVCVPLQGSGTFIVEAAIATLVRPDGQAAGAGQRRLRRAHRRHRPAHGPRRWRSCAGPRTGPSKPVASPRRCAPTRP